ncbi:MAG: hypothetical protein CK425_09925 [Parachlamydia sp.]|nr:MAG: hypothetical protein CK425_09925 [Parachlamydia sp.]
MYCKLLELFILRILKLKIYLILVLSLSSVNILSGDTSDKTQGFFVPKDEKIHLKRDGIDRAPNILLFNCHYGAGHKMATQGIVESLPECKIQVIDIYDEPLRSLDPIREIIPKWSNEELYNKMAKKEHNRLLNFAGKVAPKTLYLQRYKVEKLLMDYIAKNKPDMIISCVPLVNPMLLKVSKKFDVPFLVVTTDIDISAFCYGFKDDEYLSDWNRFRITVPFSKETWDPGFSKNLPHSVKSSLQYCFGYPTRHAFSEIFEESVLNQLREEYQIHQDENVVLVMMGGNTAQAATTYAKLLLSMKEDEIKRIVGQNNKKNKIRMICLCGNVTQKMNHNLMVQLNSLNESKNKHNEHVIIHACPGTPRIAELVSLPELCTVISKPGGSTVNEMIKKKVPMIYHISRVPLDWECGNMEYGISRDLGRSFEINGNIGDKMRIDLVHVLTYVFTLHSDIQQGRRSVPEASLDFTKNLRSTVKEMLPEVPIMER